MLVYLQHMGGCTENLVHLIKDERDNIVISYYCTEQKITAFSEKDFNRAEKKILLQKEWSFGK